MPNDHQRSLTEYIPEFQVRPDDYIPYVDRKRIEEIEAEASKESK